MTLGKVCTAISDAINPALLIVMMYWVGGWQGAVAMAALLAFIWLIVWGSDQP